MNEPTKEPPATWDFLQELQNSGKRSQSRPSSSSPPSSPSFRHMANSGLDFISEDFERPVPPRKESASEHGEESVLSALSYKLIRDTFQPSKKPTDDAERKILDDTLGMDSRHLFSSALDTRSLAEVEGNFYSTGDQSSLDIKTYTYEELGEKLRKARPPKELILSSATGLSFGELRSRFQQIEKEEQDGQDTKPDYRDIKESLNHLKNSKDLKRQLSYEELTFVRTSGVRGTRARIEYTPPNDDLLTKYYSEEQLSSKERLKLEISKLKEQFQTHEYDTGSPQVQIAILTARINNLNRHMRDGPNYKRDKHSKKGLNDMVQYRKRLMRYLRRRDWPVYCNVLTKLKLDDVLLEKRR